MDGIEGLDGWYLSDVSLELIGDDSSSGITRMEYSLDYGKTYAQYSGRLEITTEKINDILYRSVDKAGNIEDAKKLTIKIDKTEPSTVAYKSGSRGTDDWYRGDVKIGLNGDDDTSGYKTSFYTLENDVNYIEYTEPLILSDNGNYKIFYYSVDKAGNMEENKSVSFRIDKISPIVSLNASPSIIWPPTGKLVDVKIIGGIEEENLLTTSFGVSDEYGIIESVLTQFGQLIKLEAKRNGNDKDGRLYLINAIAEDTAGNRSKAEVRVIVPHSQQN